MSEQKEKLVLSFDPDTQSYKPAGHNLTPEQASEQAQKLQSEGWRGLIFDQDQHHRALSFHRCKPCKKAVEKAAQAHTQEPESQKQQEDVAAATPGEESEGD